MNTHGFVMECSTSKSGCHGQVSTQFWSYNVVLLCCSLPKLLSHFHYSSLCIQLIHSNHQLISFHPSFSFAYWHMYYSRSFIFLILGQNEQACFPYHHIPNQHLIRTAVTSILAPTSWVSSQHISKLKVCHTLPEIETVPVQYSIPLLNKREFAILTVSD